DQVRQRPEHRRPAADDAGAQGRHQGDHPARVPRGRPAVPAQGLNRPHARNAPLLEFGILFPAVLNGLTTGAVYALVALGLTLIYGVLHIINFAHGAALMMALYGVYFLKQGLGLDPYLALLPMVAVMFAGGYALQRLVINRASHGKD